MSRQVIQLSEGDKQYLKSLYESDGKRGDIQEILANHLGVTTRTVRNLAKEMGLSKPSSSDIVEDKILIYDIETSRVSAKLWNTGKQYVNFKQLKSDTTIISISWKWLGENKIHSLTWDKNHCDKKMVSEFLKSYNKATLIVTQNGEKFDNKLINTRAAKHSLFVDMHIKSFDIYKMAKRYFRLSSYSMAYMANFFGLTLKQSHEGILMWDMIEEGTQAQQKEYLKKMVDYNCGDIVTTEDLFFKLRPYFENVSRNTSNGIPLWACPISGSLDVCLQKTTFTKAGTIQRIFYCRSSKHQYRISNRVYVKFLTKDN